MVCLLYPGGSDPKKGARYNLIVSVFRSDLLVSKQLGTVKALVWSSVVRFRFILSLKGKTNFILGHPKFEASARAHISIVT